MPFEIRKAEPVGAGMISDLRLFVTADKLTLVEEGDQAAAFLLASKGKGIPGDEVGRLGLVLVDGVVRQRPATTEAVELAATVGTPVAELETSEPTKAPSRKRGRSGGS